MRTLLALVVPVPEVLDEEDVAVLDPAIFGELDGYSAPRRVSYTCDELYPGGDGGASDGTEDLLGDYIEAGTHFLAAQNSLDELPEGQTWLSPLQLSYSSSVFGLPIRLGTLNAHGVQDLLIYAITEQDKGQVGISNYPERTLQDECMWTSDTKDFGDWYAAWFAAAMESSDEAGWLMEYGWANGNCDPCANEPPSTASLEALGWAGGAADMYFTRLHLR